MALVLRCLAEGELSRSGTGVLRLRSSNGIASAHTLCAIYFNSDILNDQNKLNRRGGPPYYVLCLHSS